MRALSGESSSSLLHLLTAGAQGLSHSDLESTKTSSIESLLKILQVVFIYVSEAHATDVWPVGMTAGILNRKHTDLDARVRCCREFCREFLLDRGASESDSSFSRLNPTVLIDQFNFESSESNFESLFEVWPLRLFLIERETLNVLAISQIQTTEGRQGLDLRGFFRKVEDALSNRDSSDLTDYA